MGGTSAGADMVKDLLSQSLQHSRLLGKHVQHECEGGCSLRNSNVVSKTPSFDRGTGQTYSIPPGNHDIEHLIADNLWVLEGVRH